MNKFEQAYKAAKDALKTPLIGDVEQLRSDMSALLVDGGPSDTKKEVLDKVRTEISQKAKKSSFVFGKVGEASVITNAAGAKDAHGKRKKAATLKMFRHLYHGSKIGGASIWVYSPPVAYDKWIFDMFSSDSDDDIKKTLKKRKDEVYSAHHRKIMVDAISEAKRVASNAVVKLDTKSEETVDLVNQYFTDSGSTYDTDDIIKTLTKGYKKIAAGLGSSSLVISDEPGDRLSGGWKDWAFIYTAEQMKVIYLQNAWLQKADEATADNSGPLHRCARTIIHEMSHKELSTEDVVYGPRGLKPNGTLTGAYALHNADSWAYFAIDVNGLLTGPGKQNAVKACTGIREVPNGNLAL
ncbi:M35 family metallo-endopeptidase [Marivita sp. S0852]|uniref:M35 family metallo-endopeptidase n=1 Tax=Marivita sp. S0852 TaxID=3373893 RepID=UPI00398241F8